MLVAQSVGYLGIQSEEGFIGFLHEDSIFAAISLEDGISNEEGELLLTKLKKELKQLQITNLSLFESEITDTIVKLNLPAHFSMAIGLLYKDALYVKTVGHGQVYFRRGREFDMLMDGDKSASGYLQEYDLAIFTTAKINDLLGTAEDIKAFVELNPPKEISEKMVHEEYGEDAKGFVGLFVEFLSEESAEVLPPPEKTEVFAEMESSDSEEEIKNVEEGKPELESGVHPPKIFGGVFPPFPATKPEVSENVNEPIKSVDSAVVPPEVITPISEETQKKEFSLPFMSGLQFRQSRKISLAIVVILFAILLWSVVFGYQRRMAAQQQEKLETTKEQIQTNLKKAEDDAFLDFDRSIQLIEESKEQLEILKREFGDNKEQEIAEIENLIEKAESKIVKRDEKESVEFYDLALEAENAQGESLYLENENVAILDTANNSIYVLSLESKSIEKYTSPEVGGASKVATYDGDVFFLNSEKGVYKFSNATRASVVIEPEGWGSIIDMQLFNGNIYLLDQEKDEVYKYLVTANGYSELSSYFLSGQSVSLTDSIAMSIDSAVYIARKQDVLKYVSGISDPFTTKYPEKSPSLSGIFTSADIEQVFVWDSNNGIIYILGKDGDYIKQLSTSIVRQSKGIFMYQDEAYIFDGKKLYTVSLD